MALLDSFFFALVLYDMFFKLMVSVVEFGHWMKSFDLTKTLISLRYLFDFFGNILVF